MFLVIDTVPIEVTPRILLQLLNVREVVTLCDVAIFIKVTADLLLKLLGKSICRLNGKRLL
jgi:hypothetical protein